MASKVSVLILTYNRLNLSSKYIPGVIKNIGDIDAEVLIWDNCSNDGTYDWLYNYAQTEPKITKLFSCDQNIGMEALNHLANEASGHYIIKVDDDLIVPSSFAQRLVFAYETLSEPKLAYLAYDIKWGSSTYATRGGMGLYQKDAGKVVELKCGERILVTYHPDRFTLCSMCRLSLRQTFFDLGGHPKGVVYGIDQPVSQSVARAGMWNGFLNSRDLVLHMGCADTPNYRRMKDQALGKLR